MAARKWTAEQRKQQSLEIRQWKPWTKSTGAQTHEGKAKSSRNAYKGGLRSTLQKIAKYLQEQRQAMRAI